MFSKFRTSSLAKVLAVTTGFSVQGCNMGPTLYTETFDTVVIHGGNGGFMHKKRATYEQLRASGKTLVIDGTVYSADAFYAFNTPGACYTKNAVFRPHSLHPGLHGKRPLPRKTEAITRTLPKPLAKWFREQPAYRNPGIYAKADYYLLRSLWPEGECEEALIPDHATYQEHRPAMGRR